MFNKHGYKPILEWTSNDYIIFSNRNVNNCRHGQECCIKNCTRNHVPYVNYCKKRWACTKKGRGCPYTNHSDTTIYNSTIDDLCSLGSSCSDDRCIKRHFHGKCKYWRKCNLKGRGCPYTHPETRLCIHRYRGCINDYCVLNHLFI